LAKAPKPSSAKSLVRPDHLKPVIRKPNDNLGLDSSWERKIARGVLDPDFSLDLHGSGLDQAYGRLMHGLSQARAMGARVVLIVTGKPRPTEAADRGSARGAIRAKIVDWLGASEHAGSIAAIRGAHRRHGGQGALYVVLKKTR
jgi:DNA-nicking Smr family endonuclease